LFADPSALDADLPEALPPDWLVARPLMTVDGTCYS